MLKISSKVLIIVLVAIILLNVFANTIHAAVEINIKKAYIQTIGHAENHLKYYRENIGEYTYYTTIVAGYKDSDGTIYPVYCMDRVLPGADESPYYVTTENLLNNDEIWRVIKNGYPFTTAQSWGLEEDYDLYAVTRFAIYCVLGQTKLEYFKAESNDKEAVEMLKVLKKLVDIGKNGKETMQTNPLSAEKIGQFKEKEKYYAQEYKVNSTAEFNSYEITKTSGMPKGAYIADEEGNRKTNFGKGENFYIMVPKTQMTENIDIKATISARCKVYVILEGKTTVSGTQNYAVTAGEYSTVTTNIELKEDVNTGKIIINKIDKEDKTPIEGVEFQLLNSNGKAIDIQTTNSKGIIEFNNLVQGKYKIIETKANEKYIQNEEEFEVEVEYNKTKEIEIENEYKKRKY